MSSPVPITDLIRAHTETIQSAREALRRSATPQAREALGRAEQAYREFLMTLNGIAR